MYFSRTKLNFLRATYLCFFFFPSILMWFSRNGQITVYSLGQLLGIWSLSSLSLQFILSSRIKFLERRVGLDKVMSLHSFNAKLLLTIVLFHPVLLFGQSLLAGLNFFGLIKTFNIYYWLGEVSVMLLIFVAITSLYSKKLKLNYEHWKLIHKISYAIVVLGFVHSFGLGADIILRGPLYYWWLFLLCLTILGFLTRRYKIWIGKVDYIVVDNFLEAKNVRTIVLKPKNGKSMDYLPGQFAFINFYSKGLSRQEHHFTISSKNTSNEISFTAKAVGDYTSQLSKVKKGDLAKVDGPFGVFTSHGISEDVLYIVGGIGITPVMSMLRSLPTKKGQKIHVLYSVKEQKDIVFKKELDELNKVRSINLQYFVTKSSSNATSFITRRINKEDINKCLNKKTYVFVVGPEPMIAEVLNILTLLNIPKKQILTERFALR